MLLLGRLHIYDTIKSAWLVQRHITTTAGFSSTCEVQSFGIFLQSGRKSQQLLGALAEDIGKETLKTLIHTAVSFHATVMIIIIITTTAIIIINNNNNSNNTYSSGNSTQY